MDGNELRNGSIAAPVPAVFFRQVTDRRTQCCVTNDRLVSPVKPAPQPPTEWRLSDGSRQR
jgi:hypothetical protein